MIRHKIEINTILILIVLIILSTMIDSFAQTTKSINITNFSMSKNVKSVTFSEDYNRDGLEEQFSAEVIKEISDNIYWVKKAMLKNIKSRILKLDIKLEYYEKEVINQIDANYGYVIEFEGNAQKKKSLNIWLANAKGEKISDCITLDFEQNFSLLY